MCGRISFIFNQNYAVFEFFYDIPYLMLHNGNRFFMNSYHSLLFMIKFIYSKKATKFCEIFTLILSYVVPVKRKVKISQNYVAFSE